MKHCDTVIHAPWVLPIAPENVALEDHSVAIQDGKICALGPQTEIRATYDANETVELKHHILLPGLVNTHGHAAMTLLRGAGEDQSLKAWLEDTIWPLESKHVSTDFVHLGTTLAVAEMLKSGTTTFSDMYFLPETAAQVVEDTGIRAQLAFTVIQFPNAWSQNSAEAFDKGLAFHANYRNHDRIHIAIGPHSPYSVEEADLLHVIRLSEEHNLPVQIHLHETAKEVADAKALHGLSWIERLAEIGFLNDRVQTVHMTQAQTHEIELIASHGSKVIHCPTSNMKLASGYCPITEFIEAGVTVGIGTDGAASNNRLDMFEETRLAALLAKHHQANAEAGKAADMVHAATLGGARALELDHLIGSIEPGKQADLISVDLDHINMRPVYDPFAALLHSNAGQWVDHALVDGQWVLKQGTLTQVNEGELLSQIAAWRDRGEYATQ